MVLRTRAHDGAAALSSQFNVKTQENLIISANLIRIVRRISRPLCSCQSLDLGLFPAVKGNGFTVLRV